MTVGERIRLKREELGITQEELSKKMGYKNRSSVNQMENSDELSIKKIQKLANALNCSVAYLMGWEERQSSHNAIFNEKNANILLQINQDTELLSALEKYAKLSEDKKKSVVNMINLLSGE